MRSIILYIALWGIISPVTAQKVIDKYIDFKGKETLELDIQIADSISIHTWEKQEVYAKVSVEINDNKDNEAYLTTFDEQGDNIRIKAWIEEYYFKEKKNCCCNGMIVWEVYIPENTPFSIETINGNVTIDGVTRELKAKTISGFIDWTVKQGTNADLEMKTISGTFYSDLIIKNSMREDAFPPVLIQKINEGGYPVKLETISGDIFCRKSK